MLGRSAINEIGNRYGRLIIIERAGSTERGLALWLCRCECGNEVSVRGTSLRKGDTRSCGCLSREKTGARRRLPVGEASYNYLIDRMRRSAKQRDYTWHLTDDQIKALTSQSCYYCGIKPLQRAVSCRCNGTYFYNGLDRVDNSKGYTIDNVVSCCKRCNKAKGIMKQHEFLNWISQIYIHCIKAE